uniref:ORC3_N domain-containing protein n=1 Tax=Heterorhabditis bacteriophora TaxID=37862 RepID=A0A1I7XH42_HETBA
MGKLRVAIVQCNFADVNQMIYNVENELFNNIGIKHGETIRISSCGIPINTVIDRIRDINCSLITIEQVESMSSEYLDQLFSLLASFNISVPVLVCVSTNSMMFTSLCSQRTLELLRSKSFSLALADKIFARVMNALMSFKDIRFCGELLRFIRIQFFANDFSVAGIKKAVRFSVLQQFLKNPMWCFQNEAEFMEQVEAYNILLSTLCTKLNQYEEDLPELSDFVHEIVALLKDDCEELKLSLNNLVESVKETDKSDENNIDVESGIASVLQPWTKFTDSRYFLHGQDCTVMLTAHPARDMEQALLAKQEYNKCALSVALQTLFNRNRWKTIALSDWGSNFAGKIEEQFYTAEDSRRAIANLVVFSAAMFILPLLTMFSMYYYIFIDYFHIAGPQAMLYAGLCGMVVVIFIVGLFIRVAYKEEKDAEHRLMEQKKDK